MSTESYRAKTGKLRHQRRTRILVHGSIMINGTDDSISEVSNWAVFVAISRTGFSEVCQ